MSVLQGKRRVGPVVLPVVAPLTRGIAKNPGIAFNSISRECSLAFSGVSLHINLQAKDPLIDGNR